MYEAPKLVRFGKFRDLTLDCLGVPPYTGKGTGPMIDPAFPTGGPGDRCPEVRS